MYSPKLNHGGSSGTIRCTLLVWGILRLIVSSIWTGVLILSSIGYIYRVFNQPQDTNITSQNCAHEKARMLFDIFAITVQLVEFGMLITFITAGIKKSVRLYRIYYLYCILTLITYVTAIILFLILEYFGTDGHYLLEIYLTYHIDEFPISDKSFNLVFMLLTICDVGLEILLIGLLKYLINRYSLTPSVNV